MSSHTQSDTNFFVKFKKTHPDAVLPDHKNDTDTGYDLTAVRDVIIPAKGFAIVPTGIQVADVSKGIWYLVLPRSGLGFKHSIQPHLGVIDNGYRSDLGLKLYNFSDITYQVKKGDRVGQLAFYPLITPKSSWSDEITDTARGGNGFGSTGR